ncbi:hypothetical protein ACHHYP_08471 [Achlya hypogyna]|uniref:Uncharacterized protein n=1 Tax=Achlya hypogyna TaxID=1202772 RepID=A0A1V9YPC8_ACHHY|nr:hypothetical protein ACHHYP_08471 [Achlya hypogyna]
MTLNQDHDRAVLRSMTYNEVARLARAHGVQSSKRHMSKSFMIDAILTRDATSDEGTLDCEAKIAATHDYFTVKDEIDEYLAEHNLASASALLISWHERPVHYALQALLTMDGAEPEWSTVRSTEHAAPKDLLDDVVAYFCDGIEHVGHVVILPEGPQEWMLLGQRLRDFCYDRCMQVVARSSEAFPLATLTLLCDGNYVQLSMHPMPEGYNSLFT